MDNTNENNGSQKGFNSKDLLDKPILFDLERMKKAIESKSLALPPGLSREERRVFITSSVKNK